MKILGSFCVLLCACCALQVSRAQVVRHVPGQYATIQAAVDAAQPGDTVLVGQGRYYENVIVHGNQKAITLISNFIFTGDSSDLINTVIDASLPANPNYGMGILFKDIDTTLVPKIAGFTITGGTGYYKTYGGGIECSQAIMTIEHNIIENCSVAGTQPSGGGIRMGHGLTDTLKVGMIRFNIIRNCTVNAVSNSWGLTGGGLSVGPINAVIEGNHIYGNQLLGTPTANAFGAGIFYEYFDNVYFVTPLVIIKNNQIHDNYAEGQNTGGTLCCLDNTASAHLIIEGNTIASNGALTLAAGGEAFGGGLMIENSRSGCEVKNNIIVGNTILTTPPGMTANGGGIYLNYYLAYDPGHYLSLEGNYIQGNSARRGGGIYNNKFQLRAINNFISFNTASSHGGGIYTYGEMSSICSFINNTITENLVLNSGGVGGSLFISQHPGLLLMNDIFFNNQAPGAAELQIINSEVRIHNCDINPAAITGPYNGQDNINADPEFIDEMIWNCADPGPCWDAGRDTLTVFGLLFSAPDSCIGHHPRPLDQGVDIGACEVAFCAGLSDVTRAAIPVIVNPNPLANRATVSFTLDKPSEVRISWFSPDGRLLREICTAAFSIGSHRIELSAAELPAGLYLLRITTGDGRLSTVKLVKM